MSATTSVYRLRAYAGRLEKALRECDPGKAEQVIATRDDPGVHILAGGYCPYCGVTMTAVGNLRLERDRAPLDVVQEILESEPHVRGDCFPGYEGHPCTCGRDYRVAARIVAAWKVEAGRV